MGDLIAIVCLLLAWLIPNHYPPWNSFYNECAVGLALICLLPGALRVRGQAVPRVALVILVLAIVPWLHWWWGLVYFSGDAWVSSLYIIGLAVAAYVGYVRAGDTINGLPILLAASTLAGAGLSAIIAIEQAAELNRFGIWVLDGVAGTRPYANLAQPNNLATLIGFGLLSLLLLREKGLMGRGASLLLLALLLVGLGLTQSRMALFFGPLTVLGHLYARRVGIALKTPIWVIFGCVMVHWVFTWFWPNLSALLLLDAHETVVERGAGSVRLLIWPVLLDALSIAPWTGFGWLQVGAAELAAAHKHPPVGELWLQGHNLFLELLVWCGYPIGMLLCFVIAYWFISRLKRVTTLEGWAGMLMVSLLGVHSMLELPYHYAYFLIPIGLWIGIVEYEIKSPCRALPRWASLLVALPAAIALAGICKDYLKVEDDFRLIRFENFRIGTARAERSSPSAPFLSGLTAFLRFARTEPVAGMSAGELAEMSAVVERYPYAASMYRYSVALSLNGRLEDAKLLFIKIRHIHGPIAYARLKGNLRDRIMDGQVDLISLEKVLP